MFFKNHLASGKSADFIIICIFLLALSSCASLPNISRELETPRAEKIDFAGKNGAVSSQQSDRILGQLDSNNNDSQILQNHLAHEQAINLGSPLVLGNQLNLLQDGPATYQAMLAAIRDAKDHINLETYIFDDDEIGQQFATLLLEKQAQGVQVNLIYDSLGSMNTPKIFFNRLSSGGIAVLEFNAINPLENRKPWKLNHRDHRKLLVIDGRIAFVGGINISKVYSSNPFTRRFRKNLNPATGWRDTHVQIEGPVVTEFQTLFIHTWFQQQGPQLKIRDYFPKIKTRGNEIVRAIGSTANDPQNPIYLTLLSAISHAQRNINMTIAYFVPDQQLMKALKDAAERGVDVKLIVPSYSDSWIVFHLGRSFYEPLLISGIKIYERRDAVMHAKTASMDGVWSTVGSTNLDWRSFIHNDEINAVILGRDFAQQLDAMFTQELADSEIITLDDWQHRSLLNRLKELVGQIAAYWL